MQFRPYWLAPLGARSSFRQLLPFSKACFDHAHDRCHIFERSRVRISTQACQIEHQYALGAQNQSYRVLDRDQRRQVRVIAPQIDFDNLRARSSCDRNNAKRGLARPICGICARKRLTSTSGATSNTFLILAPMRPADIALALNASNVNEQPIEWQRTETSFTFGLAAIVSSSARAPLESCARFQDRPDRRADLSNRVTARIQHWTPCAGVMNDLRETVHCFTKPIVEAMDKDENLTPSSLSRGARQGGDEGLFFEIIRGNRHKALPRIRRRLVRATVRRRSCALHRAGSTPKSQHTKLGQRERHRTLSGSYVYAISRCSGQDRNDRRSRSGFGLRDRKAARPVAGCLQEQQHRAKATAATIGGRTILINITPSAPFATIPPVRWQFSGLF